MREFGAAVAVAAVFLFGNTRVAEADALVLAFRQTFPETLQSATMRCSTEARTLCRGQMMLLWDGRYQALSHRFRGREQHLSEISLARSVPVRARGALHTPPWPVAVPRQHIAPDHVERAAAARGR